MKVASIKMRNFKRFTDLVIRNIPDTAKLVLVVGPNGCGKSSLFDAIMQCYRNDAPFGINHDETYYRKGASLPFDWAGSVSIRFHDINTKLKRGSLYIRTAYRNQPEFMVGGLSDPGDPSQELRIGSTIENDATVGANYGRLLYDTLSGVYDLANNAKSVEELREELIGQIRSSMKVVFGDLVLNNITNPLTNGTFLFDKGVTKSYLYKNLSGGEKAAFDLLLDLHLKKRYYNDAIYCIDEIDTHLHTRVQGALLKEMVAILPEKSQLWITTHSLGVMRAALDIAKHQPGTVSVIDFDGVDPDIPCEIEPSNLGRVTWEKLFSIALDDLSDRMAPRHFVICEGSSIGSRRKDFDAEIYSRIFRHSNSDVVFVSGGSSNQVQATAMSVADTLTSMLPGSHIHSLIDRDDRSTEEVERLRNQGILVPEQRNIESYLFSDEVIELLVKNTGHTEFVPQALQIKKYALAESTARGNAPDDLKSAAGATFTGLRKLLGLTRCGNNSDEFMRDTLAPLIVPTMLCYQELKAYIIDKLD